MAGDNATTGSSIARQCGILPKGSQVIEAHESHDELLKELKALGPPGSQFSHAHASGASDEGAHLNLGSAFRSILCAYADGHPGPQFSHAHASDASHEGAHLNLYGKYRSRLCSYEDGRSGLCI